MAPHITTWGDNEHVISPVGSSTPSIVSVESILLDPTKNSLDIDENPRVANSRIKWIGPQATKLPGNRASVGMNSEADDSFIRHPKYFFMDGNITFLVRDVHDGDHAGLTYTLYALAGRRHTLLCSSILLLSRLGIFLHPICPT
jgi:hypothetical protein